MLEMPYPQDNGLRAQVRPVEQTQSAFAVMRDAFFGGAEGWYDIGDGGSEIIDREGWGGVRTPKRIDPG